MTTQNGKLKLFISYSHLDEKYVEEFRKHIMPLKSDGLLDDWHDRKIMAGQDLQNKIDENFEKADIICLFISANFLASTACLQEKINALGLKKKRGVAVIPVIVSTCGWKDDKDIHKLLALPTDGKPVSEFADSSLAWNTVYEGLKRIIQEELKIKQLQIKKEFIGFLKNIDLLTKAHPNKEKVVLDDIFIYPDLDRFNDLREYVKTESAINLIPNLCDHQKILLAGADQSGKTSLCKKLFFELREKNLVPVYISDKDNQYKGKIENKVEKAFQEQYEGVRISEIDKERIVPIIDDFHFAKETEKHIFELSSYNCQIVVVDDVFCLSFKDETIIKAFTRFKIKELTPTLRNSLIEKWVHLTDDKSGTNHDENERYQNIDEITELVNSALGKLIGNGIMPAYPFFILSVISIYETFERPMDQEITSQGYCYQALVYMYLRKQGVKNDEIDTYVNFLTEFAFYFYTQKKSELASDEFEAFMIEYLQKYNLPIKKEVLLRNLQETQIIGLDGCNNYSFCYAYLYYFFVAKYLAEHADACRTVIASIINNLHKEENAYIAVFMSHHTRDVHVLDEITLNAMLLFGKSLPATLSKPELEFFTKQADIIAKAALPPANTSPEAERAKRLQTQDVVEQLSGANAKSVPSKEEEGDSLEIELRRSVKTVEVMGTIIKNRAGSLEKPRLESIFKEAMGVHLRMLTSFFDLIKDEKAQKEIGDFISTRLNTIVEGKSKTPKPEELEKISKAIFWNTNFFVMYGLINKVVHSIGSGKLIDIAKQVCDADGSPAAFLIKHGILMWYQKNLQIDVILERMEKDDFSEIPKRIMKFMIVSHCAIHALGFQEKQKIEHTLGIPQRRLLMQQSKIAENS